jgi:hypothetical protein
VRGFELFSTLRAMGALDIQHHALMGSICDFTIGTAALPEGLLEGPARNGLEVRSAYYDC